MINIETMPLSFRLYFNFTEALQLSALLDQLEAYLFHEDPFVIHLIETRKNLKELSYHLAPSSGTKKWIHELLSLTQYLPIDLKKAAKIILLLHELRSLYELDEIHFLLKKLAQPS